jgi:hypothetical protein
MARKLSDPVIATTPEGKRIFAYNDRGQPICGSRRPGKDSSIRCQVLQTFPNGRCKKHGGRAASGIAHWNAQHLRTANSLPKHLQADMTAGGNDPDLLSLNHEITLLDVYVKQQKEQLGVGLSEAAIKKLGSMLTELDHYLQDGGEITEEFLTQIIVTWKAGQSEEATWRKIRTASLDRAKLADTAHRREKDLKNFLKAEQVYALITSVAHTCKESILKAFTAIETKYILLDRNSKQPVQRIDSAIRLDFMGDVHYQLGSLIGQPRSRNNNQETLGGIEEEEAIAI